MRSNVISKQSSITSHTQSRVTLFSRIVFTLHDVKVNKPRLSCHPNSFKGVHNFFYQKRCFFLTTNFRVRPFCPCEAYRYTGTLEPQGKPPHPPGYALAIINVYHLIMINFLRETDFEKMSLATSTFSIRNSNYYLKRKYIGVNQESQRDGVKDRSGRKFCIT